MVADVVLIGIDVRSRCCCCRGGERSERRTGIIPEPIESKDTDTTREYVMMPFSKALRRSISVVDRCNYVGGVDDGGGGFPGF